MMLDELAGSQASLVSYSTVEKGKGKTKTSVAQYEVRGTSARAKRINIWRGEVGWRRTRWVLTRGSASSFPSPLTECPAVAYDRQLGGHYFDLRLRQHLAVLFSKQKGVTSDVFKSERAMAKLLKEATRVKQILSANQEAYGRVCARRPCDSG